ncbi:MAG: accessory gene regulator B family protein [Defluviitaleaceae bacterium]|nr:accessory gene regulator B family protein [Defluviitaleaceae bacterium]
MTDHIIEKLTSLLKTDELDEYETEILKYGITTVALNLPKTILLFIIAKQIKLLKPLTFFFMFYSVIRTFSRGIHAKTPLACFLIGTTSHLGLAYLSKIIKVSRNIYNLVFAYCFYVYYKYSPSGTEVNPMYKDQIIPLKVRSLLVLVVYYFIGLKDGLIRNVAMLSVLSQSFYILPITYKLACQQGGVVHEDEE